MIFRTILLIIATLAASSAYAFTITKVTLHTANGDTPLKVELATTSQQLQQGLMYRSEIGPFDGMLFDFGKTKSVSMWMKNTEISLDMIFITEKGKVAGIAENTEPHSLEEIAAPIKVRYVLELAAGKAKEYGIQVEDKVTIQP